MIECIFTLDYEIYGNGDGSLRELVYDPTNILVSIFKRFNSRFVVFVEVAELEMIENEEADPTIELVKSQVRELYNEGFEIGLHLHTNWYKGKYNDGKWLLDNSEYNLCLLKSERIAQIIERSIKYLRNLVSESNFTPLSFRAGNWLFQPTLPLADVLVENGIKVDSSVFKGGLQRQQNMDYRRALYNNYYWRFKKNVNIPDPQGMLLELPIYTRMVPFWKMLTKKRINIQRKGSSIVKDNNKKIYRFMDFFRFRYPLKFDFSRMTLEELKRMIDLVIQNDKKNPTSFKPIVAIGHTKELVDFKTVESFLYYLEKKQIPISTIREVYQKCKC